MLYSIVLPSCLLLRRAAYMHRPKAPISTVKFAPMGHLSATFDHLFYPWVVFYYDEYGFQMTNPTLNGCFRVIFMSHFIKKSPKWRPVVPTEGKIRHFKGTPCTIFQTNDFAVEIYAVGDPYSLNDNTQLCFEDREIGG